MLFGWQGFRPNYLSLAAQLGHVEVIEALCDVGGYEAASTRCCLNAATLSTQSVSMARSAAAVRALLERGADASAVDKDSCTPLFDAAIVKNAAVAELLLTHPRSAAAARSALDVPQASTGLTVLAKCMCAGAFGFVVLLVKHGARLSSEPPPASCPIGAHAFASLPPAVGACVGRSYRDLMLVMAVGMAGTRDGAYGRGYWDNAATAQSFHVAIAMSVKHVVAVCPPRFAAVDEFLSVQLLQGVCSAPGCAAMKDMHDGGVEIDRSGSEIARSAAELADAHHGDVLRTFVSKLKACSSCNMVQYCSRACQLEHWKAHKKDCRAAAGLAAAAGQGKTAAVRGAADAGGGGGGGGGGRGGGAGSAAAVVAAAPPAPPVGGEATPEGGERAELERRLLAPFANADAAERSRFWQAAGVEEPAVGEEEETKKAKKAKKKKKKEKKVPARKDGEGGRGGARASEMGLD